MAERAYLLSLATALPPHLLWQREVAAKAHAVFGPYFEDFERLAGMFTTSGIEKRHGVKPLDWYLDPRGWPERTQAYLEGAVAMPSLDARVFGRMGFRDDVLRVPVFGRGCAGGVCGLTIAAQFAEARPGSTVLLVALELCTLAFRLDDFKVATLAAPALFGDGAAACLLRAGDGGVARIEGGAEHNWADTLDVMGWSVDPQGFGVILARAVPPFVEERLGPALDGMLERLGIARETVGRFVCHPGGTKVVAAIERALSLDEGALDHEREVLRECGNMSAPTVLFILERVMRAGLPERAVLTAMGPGFTASCASLTRAA